LFLKRNWNTQITNTLAKKRKTKQRAKMFSNLFGKKPPQHQQQQQQSNRQPPNKPPPPVPTNNSSNNNHDHQQQQQQQLIYPSLTICPICAFQEKKELKWISGEVVQHHGKIWFIIKCVVWSGTLILNFFYFYIFLYYCL